MFVKIQKKIAALRAHSIGLVSFCPVMYQSSSMCFARGLVYIWSNNDMTLILKLIVLQCQFLHHLKTSCTLLHVKILAQRYNNVELCLGARDENANIKCEIKGGLT